MFNFIKQYEEIWSDNPKQLLDDYDYQISLTKELDNASQNEFNKEFLYKIVLWKLNRFPYLEDELVLKLQTEIPDLKPKRHKQAELILRELLRTKGIALPMASTILRFLNPKVFQIIDDRAYRVLLPGHNKYPTKPQKITDNYLKNSIDIYFKYIDKLHTVVSENLPFEEADRILYLLDIKLGNNIGNKSKKD